MSEVAALRAFNREIAAVMGATVDVVLSNGKKYTGTLKGFDQNSLSIILSDVVDHGDESKTPKIFIYGKSIVSFSVAEIEVSLEGLAKQLEKPWIACNRMLLCGHWHGAGHEQDQDNLRRSRWDRTTLRACERNRRWMA